MSTGISFPCKYCNTPASLYSNIQYSSSKYRQVHFRCNRTIGCYGVFISKSKLMLELQKIIDIIDQDCQPINDYTAFIHNEIYKYYYHLKADLKWGEANLLEIMDSFLILDLENKLIFCASRIVSNLIIHKNIILEAKSILSDWIQHKKNQLKQENSAKIINHRYLNKLHNTICKSPENKIKIEEDKIKSKMSKMRTKRLKLDMQRELLTMKAKMKMKMDRKIIPEY